MTQSVGNILYVFNSNMFLPIGEFMPQRCFIPWPLRYNKQNLICHYKKNH